MGGEGAVVYWGGGTVTLTDSQVTGNSTGDGGDGGTGYNSYGGDGGSGGGIFLGDGAVITATRTVVGLNLTGGGGFGTATPKG